MRTSGNGSSTGKVTRAKAVTGPISTNGVCRATGPGAAAGDAPGGVGARAVGGLNEVEVEAFGEEQQTVEEAAGKDDVVVDHEQPVALPDGVRGEQAVEVLELPEVSGRAHV